MRKTTTGEAEDRLTIGLDITGRCVAGPGVLCRTRTAE